MLDYLTEQLWELLHEADELALRGRREQLYVRAIRVDPALAGGAEDARDARVRVLHVVDGIVVRLLHRELEVELEWGVGAALQHEEARDVRADGVEHVLEQQVLSGASADPCEHALFDEVDVLV